MTFVRYILHISVSGVGLVLYYSLLYCFLNSFESFEVLNESKQILQRRAWAKRSSSGAGVWACTISCSKTQLPFFSPGRLNMMDPIYCFQQVFGLNIIYTLQLLLHNIYTFEGFCIHSNLRVSGRH